MTLIHAILLSIVEGITEFLPVSSTGHLILAVRTLGIVQTDFIKSFEIFIQLGAILAVLCLYWKRLLVDRQLLMKIGVSFAPAAIVGAIVYPIVKNVFLGNSTLVSWSLIIGGCILIGIERQKRSDAKSTISYKQAFFIGCAQCVSFIPGVSRAGATIVGGLVSGVSREAAVEYSFLLAIPTMMAAVGIDLVKSAWQFSASEIQLLGVGFIGAFLTALAAIRVFTQYIKTHSFVSFGIYRILIGSLFLIA